MNKTLNSLKGLAGMAIILLSLYVGVFVLEGMPAIGFVLHLPSFIIVIGCLLGCTLFLLPLEEIREVLRISTREAVQEKCQKPRAKKLIPNMNQPAGLSY